MTRSSALLAAATLVCLAGCSSTSGPSPSSEQATAEPEASQPAAGALAPVPDDSWTTKRVGGDLFTTVERRGESFLWNQCSITTPLPQGYPDPTPPGAIELKKYPAVRRAEVSGSRNSDIGMNGAFWPLFQHIKKRDIAMTSPVEMDYRSMPVGGKVFAAEADGQPDSQWTMSFLYRTADLGPQGQDGVVVVTDAQPVTVLAKGLKGGYSERMIQQEIDALAAWIDAQTEWEVAGPPRAFYYNGPEVRARDRWAEAQIPVRRRAN